MAEPQPLAEALRVEILKLATEGDPKDKTLTPDVLMRILRVAKTGRDLLVSLAATPSNLNQMLKRPHNGFQFSGPNQEDDGLGDSSMATPVFAPYSQSSPGENFGMTAIREIIAAWKNQNGSSPVKLVEALVVARENGLHDVAKELEGQLGLGKKEPHVTKVAETKEKEKEPV
jgi:hypothetical protein